jgi:hypothetical protein
MATVRITKELTDIVRQRAKGKFHDRLVKAENSAPTGTQWGDYIYEKILGQYLPIMQQLPTEFFEHRTRIATQRTGYGQYVNLTFELSSPKPWPKNLPADAPAEVSGYDGSFISLKDDPVWEQLCAEVTAWKTRCDAIRRQSQEFSDGVSKLLSTYSTLSPALKAWPPLWELLPEHIKNKHKEITVRNKPEKAAPDVDTTRLTAVMAASKLGGL